MSTTNRSVVESTKCSVALTGRRPRRLKESTVGQYNIIRTIGRGRYAKVTVANHMVTAEKVAIKVIDKTVLRPYALQTLFREVRIMKMLNHPNIVKLIEVIDTQKNLYLIMEYAAGGDLFEYLEDHGSLNEEEARKIFRQIVSAIEYCHQKGIIHRDLKDENILFDSNTNIKIVDFGLSNQLSLGNKLETFCGTIECMAPELFLREKYGTGVDVWALGIILYNLLMDSNPFNGSTPEEVKKQVLLCDYKIPHFLSVDCKNLLQKIFVLDPTVRSSLRSIMQDKWINYGYKNKLIPHVEPEQHKNNEEKALDS